MQHNNNKIDRVAFAYYVSESARLMGILNFTMYQAAMEYSEPSLSLQRLDLVPEGNITTTTDLIIQIPSLLPAKSLLRFQSVSKLWFSTIRSKTFAHSFLTRSHTRPRLLLMFYLLKNSQRN
ncbi:hypothetical protein Rs2_11686 [Raphanus sativus]|nr:hypothetical protein Rs2_11686 [Raphanus sativus]